jgi:hypothetical protein
MKSSEKVPCNFDHNGECLICDCWISNCAYIRMLDGDYKYESKEELEDMFKYIINKDNPRKMNMKQTAVEFLWDKLLKGEFINDPEELFNQAKEMEKERMIEFTNDYVLTQCNASFEGNVSAELSAEEYYELTFKSE